MNPWPFLKRIGLSKALASAAALATAIHTNAAPQRIAWVSFHAGDNQPSAAAAGVGFTQAPDVEYTRLLQAAGHTVTRYVTTATPDTNLLNGFDLVIISRSVPSGNYDTVESTALWHSLTKPTMVLGGYVLRASRLGYTFGETMVDTGGEIRLTAANPSHPIFTGVPLDANNVMVNPYAGRVTHNNILQAGISVNRDEVTTGGEVLATVATETDGSFGGMMVAEFPAGTVMANELGDTTAAKRLVFLTGSREAQITSEAAGIFDLNTDGARMFLNAVHYMTGQPTTEPPPLISNIRPASGTRLHLAELGLSFQASSGTAGGIPATNITLQLNGTNVPASQLTIAGTPQSRTISFSNLLAQAEYTGVITVRDAGGREVSQNFSFDTLDPVPLPAAYAFPIANAVSAASGMRARVVQGPNLTPGLANTQARAEAQLAGTLIDTATGEPYLNEAIPSTDNADGAYNVERVNWSVQAETGAERGSFQAPNFPDQPFPGVTHTLNIAVEVLAFLELQPGRYYMGVNSDDGFAVFTGPNARDLFAMDLGRFDGGRGAADTIFQFRVTEAGLYPFRLVYYQGEGDGNLEWFTMNPITGEKVLINDRANSAGIKAWRQISVLERPHIAMVSPGRGAANVKVDAPIIVTVQENGAQIQANTAQFVVNGQTVTPQLSRNGSIATLTYDPPQNLPSEQNISVQVTFTDSASRTRTETFQFATEYVPPVVQGKNIVWVSFHPADNEPTAAAAGRGFTNAADIGYTTLLTNAGHTVTRYVTTATPDVAYLQGFDLVIISRSNPSGNFQTAESAALWHSLTNPVIHLGGYTLRQNRLGLFTGNNIPDTTSSNITLNVKAPNHPIFNGIDFDANTNMVNSYAHRIVHPVGNVRGISVNRDPVPAGGTILATVATPTDGAANGVIISEYPAATRMANASSNIIAGHQLVFLTGGREPDGVDASVAGLYDLDPDGAKMFLNAVAYMTGSLAPEPDPIHLAATRNGNNLVISWPSEGATGFMLQATDSLNTPNWQNAGGTPTTAGGTTTQSVPISGNMRFFRLVRP